MGIAFTILLVQYAFVFYRIIKSKGNVNKALLGSKPLLSGDKLSMIPKNDKLLIGFVRYFCSIGLIFINCYALNQIFIENNIAMDSTLPLVNVGIWFLCYFAQAGSYK